jgi:hypothetical protein
VTFVMTGGENFNIKFDNDNRKDLDFSNECVIVDDEDNDGVKLELTFYLR